MAHAIIRWYRATSPTNPVPRHITLSAELVLAQIAERLLETE
jgi:hypothetical protein